MEKKKLIENLYSLAQLDIDAIHAYDQAIEKIDIETVADQLRRFRADHQRHFSELSGAIARLGGRAPEFKPDFKGFFIEGLTSLRSITGTAGALKAMKSNELLTTAKYKAVDEMDLPPDVKQIVDRNLKDEQRHYSYIKQCVEDKIWEKYGKQTATQMGVPTGDELPPVQ